MDLPTPEPLRLSGSQPVFHALLDYEQKFSQAAVSLPFRRPWIAEEQAEIVETLKQCLRIREEWVPVFKPTAVATTEEQGYHVEHLQVETWPGVRGAADLYLPSTEGPHPAVLVVCGHAQGGKRAHSYQQMATHLARQGIVVLISDNIGQGERTPMGHFRTVEVFQCGLSLQGLIAMEATAALSWLREHPQVDPGKVAVTGNSGGGLLSLLVGVLCRDQLFAVASSGYPSTFDFIARKEKGHCHCNLIPGIVGELEMWQLYGCIAPKRLLIFQGSGDHFFPADLFVHTARKIASAYTATGSPEQFTATMVEGGHPWDTPRRTYLTRFFCEVFALPFVGDLCSESAPLTALPPCYPGWPEDAKTANQLARELTGFCGSPLSTLADVVLSETALSDNLPPEISQILAQYELFLRDSSGSGQVD